MAQIVGLNGKEIKDIRPAPVRDAEVDRLINHITDLNSQGRIKSLVISVIEDGDRCGNAFVICKPTATATIVGGVYLAASRVEREYSGSKWIEMT